MQEFQSSLSLRGSKTHANVQLPAGVIKSLFCTNARWIEIPSRTTDLQQERRPTIHRVVQSEPNGKFVTKLRT